MSVLHRWIDKDGGKWACAASDHGPFCRLCQRVNDEVSQACLENVDEGLMEVEAANSGELRFRLTAAGTKKVERLLQDNPKAQEFFEQAKGKVRDDAVIEELERQLDEADDE